ncbi:MAG: pectin acetylesterase-family hydrolase [Bacteroidota bacterium]
MINFRKIAVLIWVFMMTQSCSDDVNPSENGESVLSLSTALNNPTEWTWVDNENIISRDGSSGGYAVNFSDQSDKLLIYLPGGRACFDAFSCGGNEPNYSEEKFFAKGDGTRALFNRSVRADNSNNLFKDWHQVFVAYSSGDVYSGDNEGVDVGNGGDANQTFKGFTNFSIMLNEVVSFLVENQITISEVFLAGSSAGGYGVLANFEQLESIISNSFPNVQFTMLNDAGYLLSDKNVVPACLNLAWDNLFDIQVPGDLDTFVNTPDEFKFLSIYEYLNNKYPDANFGFYGSYSDLTSRTLLSLGQDNCGYDVGLIDADIFKAGLLNQYNSILKGLENWSVYYAETESHTALPFDEYKTLEVKDKKFADWVNELHAGSAEDVIDD